MNPTESVEKISDETAARLQREADFHDHVAEDDAREDAKKFYSVCRNSYDHFFRLIFENAGGKAVLEYGCGTGSNAYELARRGAHVTGIDISPVAIEHARRTASEQGLESAIEFRVMNAEALEFPDRSLDVICGNGILHHLDLERSYREISRVLKPGGVAVFTEPMGHNPLINWYRNRTPEMRTPDEHPLMMRDLELARRIFPKVAVTFYHLTSLGAVPFRNTPLFKPLYALTESIDRLLMKIVPPLRGWAWMAVIEMRK